MQLEWDGNTKKDDKEFKMAGKSAKVHETRISLCVA